MAKGSEKTPKIQNSSGTEKKRKKKHILKKIYTADDDTKDLTSQPASLVAVESVKEVAVDDPLLEPRSIFLEDKLPYVSRSLLILPFSQVACSAYTTFACYEGIPFVVARYEPGAGFVLNQEPPSLSCSGLDPSTHELWLLQLPLDVTSALNLFDILNSYLQTAGYIGLSKMHCQQIINSLYPKLLKVVQMLNGSCCLCSGNRKRRPRSQ